MKCDNIEDLKRFLAIQEQALGQESPEVAATVSKLADMYFAEGALQSAEELYKRALAIREKVRGPHRKEADETRERLAAIELAKQTATTEHLSLKALAQVAESGPALHPKGPALKESVTEAIKEAVKEAEIEVSLLRQTVGEHPVVADSLTKLADLYCRAKMYQQMEAILEDALAIREKSLGPDHATTTTALKNLAQLYCVLGKIELAEPLFQRCLSVRRKMYGDNHEKVREIENLHERLMRKALNS